ncbi:peptide chain release factor N(5)-glutamine methyltransferase [Paractinoplanes toevensis]|uniref:Release factor glutamine methyltransferase n=1 Tax=Paractinoplanes toevensis TaxID=571911 RepID=A0A919W2D9_9ACTN|nr:peptide chain release factor N(5)-glutamine methyltransferase [Actinoplanes toevensis]GIM91504.1 release factor glutamine methyltransferase [Actinoplanes toevensis]
MDPDDEHPSRPSVSKALAAAAAELAAAGVESPRVDAELLAAHVLEIPRGRLLLIEAMRPDELRRFTALVAERARRIPLQHLLGTAAFRHLELSVGDGVFIPRPETELLAGWGIDRTAPGAVAVDLCSGTGAIALSLADETKADEVYAVERSPVALSFLRRNAAAFPVVRVVEGDVTDPSLLASLRGRVDVLLCNPPYVPEGTPVPPEVAEHDPAEAVFGGADGLSVIRPVVALAATLLKSGGHVGIEHDDRHGSAVPAILREDGRFTEVTAHDDYSGRPRFTTARRS